MYMYEVILAQMAVGPYSGIVRLGIIYYATCKKYITRTVVQTENCVNK